MDVACDMMIHMTAASLVLAALPVTPLTFVADQPHDYLDAPDSYENKELAQLAGASLRTSAPAFPADMRVSMLVLPSFEPEASDGLPARIAFCTSSRRSGSGKKIAQTWSPNENTTPAMLVRIGATIASYCEARAWWLIPLAWYFGASLDNQVNALDARLKHGGKRS